MLKPTRREFLKRAGISVAGVATLNWKHLAKGAMPATERGVISSHRPLLVPGVHAYADQQSVSAGQAISFYVSSTVPYRFSVCRLGLKVDEPAGDEVLHEFSQAHPHVQPIHPGSYAHIGKALTRLPGALTLECWARQWKAVQFA